MRILQIAEEYGEVATAWAGVSGQNPCKGVTSTVFDPRTVLTEVVAKVNSRFTFADADTLERR